MVFLACSWRFLKFRFEFIIGIQKPTVKVRKKSFYSIFILFWHVFCREIYKYYCQWENLRIAFFCAFSQFLIFYVVLWLSWEFTLYMLTCICLLWRALNICLLFCIWIPFVYRYGRSGRIIKTYFVYLYDLQKPEICLITNLSISFVLLYMCPCFFIPHSFRLQVKQVLKQCESLFGLIQWKGLKT